MKRIVSFDIIRAVAIVGILLAHQFVTEGSLFLLELGRWLGSTFSAVFLCLSALLLGRAWNGKGRPAYGWSFLLHRFSIIVIPYWLLLTVFLLLAYVTGNVFSLKNIAMNFALLGWLAKIPGIGHFWFVTMISFCYVAIALISWLFQADWGRRLFPWMLLLGCAGLYALLAHFNLPAYMAVILLFYGLIFVNADSILAGLERHGKRILFVVVPILLLLITGLFASGILAGENNNLIVCGCSLCGIAMLLLLQTIFSGTANCPRFVSAVSGISYEWYLVHHPMIIGPLALTYVLPRPTAVALYWLLSLCFAFVLHYLSSFVYKLFRA